MKQEKFKPVILGIDIGSYSIVRTIYEFYKIKSIVIGKYKYWMTSYSKITETYELKDNNEAKVLDFLIKLKQNYPDTKLLLFGCSEIYINIIVKNKEKLSNYYVIPYIDLSTFNKLTVKKTFYEICEKLKINYPKTIILTKDNYNKTKISFKYPVIAKAAFSAIYLNTNFEGKKKVYLIHSYQELLKTMELIYKTSYQEDFIIQEYISGEDSNMRVLTCFCDKNSDVIFSSVGRVVIEEKGPDVIGNYTCIYNISDEKIVEDAKKLLKAVKYVGYANFDVKYNDNDGKYYFFELNARLGRSNFYMGSGNTNYLEPLIDNFIYEKSPKKYNLPIKELYLTIPFYIIKKYVKDIALIKEIKKLKRNNPLFYKKDLSLKRIIYIKLSLLNFIRKYKKYYE